MIMTTNNNVDGGSDDGEGDISIILGNDIFYDILCRFTVKSLVQFKCVCKRWRSLIEEDSEFCDLYLARSKTRQDLLVIIPEDNDTHFFTAEDLFKGGAAIHRRTLSFNRSTFNRSNRTTLDPVNGLICFVDDGVACIYNLGTKEITPWIKTTIKKEEKKPGFIVVNNPVYGFGFDPATKEHKVICWWEISRYTSPPKCILIGGKVDEACEVLTVGENKWRRINEVPPYKLNKRAGGVYANGSIYWRNVVSKPSNGHEVIVAFDVGSERFRVIPIPNFIIDVPRALGSRADFLLEVDGHIALVDRISEYKVKLWICDEDGRNEKMTNWIEETISLPFPWGKNRQIFLRAIPRTDMIVLKSPTPPIDDPTTGGSVSLFYYDRKKKTSREVEITGISPVGYSFCAFAKSLWPVQKKHHHNHIASSTRKLKQQFF